MTALDEANNEAQRKDGQISSESDQFVLEKPKGAKWFVFGAWHKVGEFSRIFLHNGLNWIASSKQMNQITRELKNQERML